MSVTFIFIIISTMSNIFCIITWSQIINFKPVPETRRKKILPLSAGVFFLHLYPYIHTGFFFLPFYSATHFCDCETLNITPFYVARNFEHKNAWEFWESQPTTTPSGYKSITFPILTSKHTHNDISLSLGMRHSQWGFSFLVYLHNVSIKICI